MEPTAGLHQTSVIGKWKLRRDHSMRLNHLFQLSGWNQLPRGRVLCILTWQPYRAVSGGGEGECAGAAAAQRAQLWGMSHHIHASAFARELSRDLDLVAAPVTWFMRAT